MRICAAAVTQAEQSVPVEHERATRHGDDQVALSQDRDGVPNGAAADAVLLSQRCLAGYGLPGRQLTALDLASQDLGELQVERRRRHRVDHEQTIRTTRTGTIVRYVLNSLDVLNVLDVRSAIWR
jgi:hypothetical protein